MTEQLTGNEAVARGIYEAGVEIATSHPGTPGNGIIETLVQYDDIYVEWSVNEKVAAEVAIGASIAGKRSIVVLKNVGLNVASDPLIHYSYTGVNAGFVVVVVDEAGCYYSDTEQDNRYYARLMKMPMLEPANHQEAKDFIKLAFEMSEKFDTPVFYRLMAPLCHAKGEVEPLRVKKKKEIVSKLNTLLLSRLLGKESKFGIYCDYYHGRPKKMINRVQDISNYVEKFPGNEIQVTGHKCGIITSGPVYYEAKKCFPEYSYFKLGVVYPLPFKKIIDFSRKIEKLYEAGVEIATSHPGTPGNAEGIDVYGKNIFPKHGPFSQEVIKKSFNGDKITFKTGKPEKKKMCAGCPYRGLFYALKQVLPLNRKYFVAGDVGCDHHAELKPFCFMDSQIAMGSSIGNIACFQQATQLQYSVAIIGDGAFLHSGMNALLNMVYNQNKGTVIILDNGTEATVNGQNHAGSGYTLRGESAQKIDYVKLCEALGVEYIRTVDPYNLSQTQAILTEELNRKTLSVIISTAPCVKYVRKSNIGEPKIVDLDKCVGCGTCSDVSCSAIQLQGKIIWHRKSKIDTDQCIGCGVCSQVCSYEAIK
jgi:indolepyruvate ferredoxin oxidoreductase alpha subunit